MEKFKRLAFSFEGRMTRLEYMVTGAIVAILSILASRLLEGGLSLINLKLTYSDVTFWILAIPMLIFSLWATFALNTKRLHDLNKSGWWQVIMFIPSFWDIFLLIGGISSFIKVLFFLYLCFRSAKAGSNRFGPDPRERLKPL